MPTCFRPLAIAALAVRCASPAPPLTGIDESTIVQPFWSGQESGPGGGFGLGFGAGLPGVVVAVVVGGSAVSVGTGTSFEVATTVYA